MKRVTGRFFEMRVTFITSARLCSETAHDASCKVLTCSNFPIRKKTNLSFYEWPLILFQNDSEAASNNWISWQSQNMIQIIMLVFFYMFSYVTAFNYWIISVKDLRVSQR